MMQPACPLDAVVAAYRRWLYLPDLTPLYAMLGTVAANYIPGDPVWLMLVGPPGCGKSELLRSLGKLPHVHNAGTLTEAALLSGTPMRETDKNASGGLLREVDDFGFLVVKDFTSILSMHREKRAAVLAALREIYDGSWTRLVGVDGGRTLSWDGKLAVLAAVTQTIDSHHAVISTMGERFIFCRMPKADAHTQGRQALAHAAKDTGMRDELAGAVAALFGSLQVPEDPSALEDAEESKLVDLATLAVHLRSAVERNTRNHEIELVPDPEAPSRLVLVFRKLLAGLEAIGVRDEAAWGIVRSTALDCAPVVRRKVFAAAAHERAEVSLAHIAQAVGYPSQTVRRALEDLSVHQLLRHISGGQGRADSWILTEETEMLYSSLFEDRSRKVG